MRNDAPGPTTGGAGQLRTSFDNHLNHPYNNSSARTFGPLVQSPMTNAYNANHNSLPQPQDVHQQRPAQTFNIFGGGQATFSFKTMQGSQVLKVQGNPELDGAEEQPTANAHYETNNEFIGDGRTDDFVRNNFAYHPVAPRDDLDPSFLNSRVADNGHVNVNMGNNNLIAFAQHDFEGIATPPGALNPEVENGNHDQSVASADVLDEDAIDLDGSISLAQKRRRASSDDGNSSDEGVDNSEEGLPETQHVIAKRKSSKRAKSNTPVESIEESVSTQTPSFLVTRPSYFQSKSTKTPTPIHVAVLGSTKKKSSTSLTILPRPETCPHRPEQKQLGMNHCGQTTTESGPRRPPQHPFRPH